MEILTQLWQIICHLFEESGFSKLSWENYVMVGISFVLMYLAIKKQFEPLLLLPIAFGMCLVNLFPGIMGLPTTEMLTEAEMLSKNLDPSTYTTTVYNGVTYYNHIEYGGLCYYLYQGVKLGIYPPLIFLGIGCMTDFGPLIANPKSFILGAAAQVGIFLTFIIATALGIFTPAELTEEDKADGTIAFYTTGNENNFLLLNYSSYENLTIETFYYYFLQNGYSVELISVNGIPAILQRDETRNQILLIFQTRDGKFLQLIFSPLSDEVIFAPIIASIQPNVEEDSAESVIPVNPVSTLISK